MTTNPYRSRHVGVDVFGDNGCPAATAYRVAVADPSAVGVVATFSRATRVGDEAREELFDAWRNFSRKWDSQPWLTFVVVGVFVDDDDDDDEDVEEEVEEVDAEEGVLEKDICSALSLVELRVSFTTPESVLSSPRRRRWYGWTDSTRRLRLLLLLDKLSCACLVCLRDYGKQSRIEKKNCSREVSERRRLFASFIRYLGWA